MSVLTSATGKRGADPAHRGPASIAACLSIIAVVVALLMVTAPPASASPSPTAQPTAQIQGRVYALVQVGDRTYIGGEFTMAGTLARRNAALIRADGSVDPAWDPSPSGVVRAMAASADGSRIFLGGEFLNAGGAPRSRVAAVNNTNGAVVGSWIANASGTVFALAARGSALYVGGLYTTIDGNSVRNLARVNVNSGDVETAFQPQPTGSVRAVAVSPDGNRVYAGGGFTSVAGVNRDRIAEINAGNGSPTGFRPSVNNTLVMSVALSPDGSRFYYSTNSNHVRAFRPATSNAPLWSNHTNGDTQAMAASASELYIGGHFTRFDSGTRRVHLASLRVSDGSPTGWNPVAEGGLGVWAITLRPDSLSAGGAFTTVGGIARRGYARFSGAP